MPSSAPQIPVHPTLCSSLPHLKLGHIHTLLPITTLTSEMGTLVEVFFISVEVSTLYLCSGFFPHFASLETCVLK